MPKIIIQYFTEDRELLFEGTYEIPKNHTDIPTIDFLVDTRVDLKMAASIILAREQNKDVLQSTPKKES